MKKKILSIDGGGVKGIFAAKILAEVENELNCRICDYFDIITGTSTGAIIASGLAMGISAETILNMYREKKNDIFSGYGTGITNRFAAMTNQLFSSKYENLAHCKMKLHYHYR